MLVLGSFSTGLEAFGSLTLAKYIEAYTDPALAAIILNTVVFTVGSAAVATVLALFLAFLNTRTNIPFKSLFGIISIIPMMIPHILFCVSWALLLNPSNGLFNLLLRELGLSGAAVNIYSMPGMILVEGLLDLPIAYLIVAPAMSAFDVSLEESSKVCGASNLRTLARVTLPVLRPAILAAFILVIVRSLASFAVPAVLGMPGRIYVLASHIYRIIATGFAADYGQAAAVGMSALSASIVLIVIYRRLTAAGEKFVTVTSRGYRPAVIDLKGARLPLCGCVGLISFALIVLPVAVLFYVSLLPYSMVPSAKALGFMSWKNWLSVIRDPVSFLALKNSVVLGIGGASLGVVLSIFVAYIIVKVRTRAAGVLESLSFLSFSFPGIVIGVGFMESSRVCGAGTLLTLRRVVIPLLVPGIVSGWILMATMFVRELTLSVVLSRPGTEVIAVQILRYAEDGLWGRLSALGIIMIIISTALVAVASFIGRKFALTERG